MFVSVIWPLIVSFLCYPYLIFIDGITKPNESEVIRQALVIELFLGVALELVIRIDTRVVSSLNGRISKGRNIAIIDLNITKGVPRSLHILKLTDREIFYKATANITKTGIHISILRYKYEIVVFPQILQLINRQG